MITQEEIQACLPQAIRKLHLIIEREGDANGERLKPYYLEELIRECVALERFAKKLRSEEAPKRKVKKTNNIDNIHNTPKKQICQGGKMKIYLSMNDEQLEPPESYRQIVHRCDCCDDEIREGDEYLEIGDKFYCIYCLEDNFTTMELLKLLGIRLETAAIDTEEWL